MEKFIFFILTTINLGFAQELPLLPEFDKNISSLNSGVSVRNLNKKTQVFLPSIYLRLSANRVLPKNDKNNIIADRQTYLATSVDGISFDERENSITFGLKASHVVTYDNLIKSNEDMYVVGHEIDMNTDFLDYKSRVQRTIYYGDNFVFDHGMSLGTYREKGLNAARSLGQSVVLFSGGADFGVRSKISLKNNSSLNISARTFMHVLPNVKDRAVELEALEDEEIVYDKSNGGRVQGQLQVSYNRSNVTVFLSSRNEFLKNSDYVKLTNQFSFGALFSLTGSKKKYKD